MFGQKDRSSPSPSLLLLGAPTGSQASVGLCLCCCRNRTEERPKLFSWLRPPEQAPRTAVQKCPLPFSLGTNKIRYHDSFWLKNKSLQKGRRKPPNAPERGRKRKTVLAGNVGPGPGPRHPADPGRQRVHQKCVSSAGWSSGNPDSCP